MKGKKILGGDAIEKIIDDCAEKIAGDIKDIGSFAIVGIQTRGVALAERIRHRLEERTGTKVPMGALDITFYRDDLSTRGALPVIKETKIPFDIEKLSILLVDDVIFTGRTTKAALESLTGFGRPREIRLFVLIDRGNRELPIQPDYCGFTIDTKADDTVKLFLRETDDKDEGIYLL